MKITEIVATPVNLPLDAPYYWSHGELPGFTKTVIQVRCDEGLEGLGEAPGDGAASLIADTIAPRLIGRDPIDIQGCEALIVPPWRGLQSTQDLGLIRAFGGIETALWDLRGKAWNQPLYQLLGGAVRHRIPVTDYFAFRPRQGDAGGEETPEEVADYCLALNLEFGTTFFEGKFTTPDWRQSLRVVQILRDELGPDALLRVDSNQAYSVTDARLIAPALEELGLRYWEDPVGSPEEMARLRESTSIPFSTHNADLIKAQHLGVPNAIVGDPANQGGILRLQRFVGACEALGIDFWCYSGDSGIQAAAYLHLCAATPWIREPNQSLFRMMTNDVIEEGPFVPRNNGLDLPDGPGLGVTLSAERLAHAHQLYLEQGGMNKYHDRGAPGRFRPLPYDPLDR
ncbi:MAG: mandelate racemase/muconate lactonizing enzyme family protein [Rhodospirillales bacterium]